METAQDVTRRKQLIDLIATATTLEELLAAGPTQRMVEFFGAERATIYAVDAKNNHLYSLAKTGDDSLAEIRVKRKPTSIAGFVGTTRRAVSITNCYDPAELQKIDSALKFDDRWDQHTGFRTVWHQPIGGRFGKQAAITRTTTGNIRERLALEAMNRR